MTEENDSKGTAQTKSVFTEEELAFLTVTDSLDFGFIKWNEPNSLPINKKCLLTKAVKCLEKVLADHQHILKATAKSESIQKEAHEPQSEELNTLTLSKVYCKLGHFNLLLEDFPKALSAYQNYLKLCQNYWKNAAFTYGLAHVYFHYREYLWAIKLFRNVLYLYPGFLRANEIHLRLGIAYKILQEYELSLKHLQAVLSDSSPCTLTKTEVRFHIGHLYEVEGKHAIAKEAFEQILEEKDLSAKIKAEVSKKLGWMLHVAGESVGEKNERQALALHYLQKAIETNPSSRCGQSLYFLGRTYASLGKVHDAFVSYRSSVDRSEANADVWCSIGLLYQQQSQNMDALQAHICSVQLCKEHTPAWTNLGLLYESSNQSKDAMKCYLNAINGKGPANPNLINRVKLLKNDIFANNTSSTTASTSGGNTNAKPNKLPSIEDAWNFPISQEMASRQQNAVHASNQGARFINPHSTQRQSYSSSQGSVSQVPNQVVQGQMKGRPATLMTVQDQPDVKRMKLAPGVQKPNQVINPDANVRPSFFLNQQQLQLLSYFQQNQANLSPQQRNLFQQLQQQYHQMQINQQQKLIIQRGGQLPAGQHPQSSLPTTNAPSQLGTSSPTTSSHVRANPAVRFAADSITTRPSLLSMEGKANPNSIPNEPNISNIELRTVPSVCVTTHSDITTTGNVLSKPQTSEMNLASKQAGLPKISSTEPNAILQDRCASISDRDLKILLSQKDIASSLAEDLLMQLSGELKVNVKTKTTLSSDDASEMQKDSKSGVASSTSLNQSVSLQKTSIEDCAVETSLPEIKGACSESKEVKPFELKFEQLKNKFSIPSLSINMNSSQILSACKGLGKSLASVTNTSLFVSELCKPPFPPEAPYPPVTKDQLLPSTPSVFLEYKKDAFSSQLQDFCLAHPITVVRGLCSVLKLDLGLFSTKTLVEAHPEHSIEVRTQLLMKCDENWDASKTKQRWQCDSHRSHTTIARYAQYQASSFQESLKEEQEKASTSADNNASRDSDSDSNSSMSRGCKKGLKTSTFKTVKFGTNVDLSDESKWGPQLQELSKLPMFLKIISASNMLSHIGTVILGMNSLQLYLKVPGCRTPAHQENLDFNSVNINVGPGSCMWYAVDEAYWGVIYKLCEKNNVNYLHGSWWPLLDDLFAENVPVYRFLQRPGDLVYVNAGAVHWVQAEGFCNAIAWNVGPLRAHQYKLAVERYEFNKLEGYQSIVPMIRLTWNLARNLKISDVKLYEHIKYCLMRSLHHCKMILEFVKELNKDVKFHGIGKSEAAHYCTLSNCEVEVFNLLFVRDVDKKSMVFCFECARKKSPKLEDFIVLEEYTMDDLSNIYDNFVLHPVPSTSL